MELASSATMITCVKQVCCLANLRLTLNSSTPSSRWLPFASGPLRLTTPASSIRPPQARTPLHLGPCHPHLVVSRGHRRGVPIAMEAGRHIHRRHGDCADARPRRKALSHRRSSRVRCWMDDWTLRRWTLLSFVREILSRRAAKKAKGFHSPSSEQCSEDGGTRNASIL